MTHRDSGPRRSDSPNSYLLSTRILGVVAALALVAGILSDFVDGSFWQTHALLAGLSASVLVVMLSAGIFNEAIERRRRQRWSVLAQYVMLDLARNARLIWIGLLELAGLISVGGTSAPVVEVGGPIVRDRDQLTPAFASLVAASDRRQTLHDQIAVSVLHTNELLGRWATVMLTADVYAEVIDRHVELASNVAWLGGLLDSSSPPDDQKRRRLARVSAAVQIEGQITDEMLVERLVMIAQLAEDLDRGTLELAMRLVPIEWWRERMGVAAPDGLNFPGAGRR